MRYPDPLKKNGTIGFIAPSFGCAIEPYLSRFENAKKIFEEMGYKLWLGPNCYEDTGVGISNTPEKCGAELNAAMTDDNSDVIITCGGGELMCEVVPYIDFEKIKNSRPKWYMGYSDNTNFTFLSNILADTAAIYGPCAPAFGREPWHKSVEEALHILTEEITSIEGYDLWEKDLTEETSISESESEPDPLLSYAVNTPENYVYCLPQESKSEDSQNALESKEKTIDTCDMEGRLIGGCVDILNVLIGTKYDKVADFLEKYKDDGFIWFLECCDLDNLSMRRAYWSMREAGWFKYVKGFLIGRPRRFGEDIMGVDQYNAVTDILGELNVPIIMDLDIGHLPPMMPIISGCLATVHAEGNSINIKYNKK